MKKILVPIDFSPASRAGFEGARLISSITQAEIFALNICEKIENNHSAEVSFLMQQEAEEKQASRLMRFTGTYPNLNPSEAHFKPNIYTHVRSGKIVDEILAAAQENEVDLIVIGTKAKHNLWEYLFGSVSTSLLKKSTKPVLIVPEGLQFKKPVNIAFANDFQSEETPLKYLNDFAFALGAKVKQVHVNILPSDFFDLKEEVVETPAGQPGKGKPGYTTVIRDKSIKKGLDYFVKTHHIDLLALYLPQRTFTEDLLHRSVSKQLVLSSKIPMLIFKE